jgi:DNA-directed RNA polymerase III subunit RPC7
MPNGLKRKADKRAPTEDALFDSFNDNQTYSARYTKKRRRIPKLDTRPYVTDFFPPELRDLLVSGAGSEKRQMLSVTRMDAKSYVDRMIQQEQERLNEFEDRAENEEEDAEENENADENEGKPDAVDEEDNWSAVSSDSEESGDDYNAEQYFDNGDEEDGDDGGDYDTYD